MKQRLRETKQYNLIQKTKTKTTTQFDIKIIIIIIMSIQKLLTLQIIKTTNTPSNIITKTFLKKKKIRKIAIKKKQKFIIF